MEDLGLGVTAPLRIAVIGAGWAGCAAASACAQHGHQVVLLEASSELGGRARRLVLDLDGESHTLDNGQHLLIGAYTATAALLRELGVTLDSAFRRRPFQLVYPDGTALRAARLPGLLKDKFKFLAQEEQKHRGFIEQVYKAKFPKKKITLPENTPGPLPPLVTPGEDTPLGTILKSAMTAEQAAHDFYQALSQQFTKNDTSIRNTLQYFADMELQHYKILEIEKESMDRFEQADIYWDMVPVGP